MAEMNFTPQQQKVIDSRDCNLLVSAAAGSGKTAVLVERIIHRIASDRNPINIDQLLIVTFTKAAAGEMRERIGQAIEKKVQEHPDHVHLQKQLTLLYNAQITTIDSFCLSVIRNHFHTIDLDPSFRIAEEAELTLLKSDLLGALLEEKYEEASEDFLEFVECYSASKSDEPIENFILKLYQFSQSYPYPHEWLAEREQDFMIETVEDLNGTKWMEKLLHYVKVLLQEAKSLCEKAIALTNLPDGPRPYLDALLSDVSILDELLTYQTYEEYQRGFEQITFARLSTKKWPEATEERKEEVKAYRQRVKKILSDLAEDFFFQPMEEMLEDMKKVRRPMLVLLSLTHEFLNHLEAAKEENNLVDFSDIEHFALKILVTKEDGKIIPTQVAREMSEQFAEIMIDEYQDSNYVQEYILNSISKEEQGHPNIFMVGDVKQSIYKFRMARPELFMDKYEKYSATEEGLKRRIELSKNFRSRAEVLDSINGIFEKIMTKELGGIAYTKEVALYPGAQFPQIEEVKTETEEEKKQNNEVRDETKDEQNKDFTVNKLMCSDTKTELLLLDLKEEEESFFQGMEQSDLLGEDEESVELSKRELEAKAVAMRIKKLVEKDKGFLVTKRMDGEQKLERAKYGDIVILLRTMSGWSETFIEILKQEGIPAYSDTQSGYFQTLEVKTVLNYLRILDNPRQDIPFTAILYSPMVGLSAEELSLLRFYHPREGKKLSIYEAVRTYVREHQNTNEVGVNQEDTLEKLLRFLDSFDRLRERVSYLSVHEIILELYQSTGYDLFVYGMPGGVQRRNNLMMLVQHAVSFEESSYHGLFQFIRYIERLLKYEIDYGEAGGLSEEDDAVRIMSIHKSKGLEFPIVILAGMGKQFNTMDARDKIVLHADYGIGPECIDYQLRTKCPTLLKQVIKKNIVLDNLGEELRVLYVALTRAKEKLIMIGSTTDANALYDKWRQEETKDFTPLRFQTLASAKDYFSLVGPVALSDERIRVGSLSVKDLIMEEYEKQVDLGNKQEELAPTLFLESQDEEMERRLLERLSYRYTFEKEAMLPIKTTVSELKKLSQKVDEELTQQLPVKELQSEIILEPTLPKFLAGDKEISGAERGNLYHKIMELADFEKLSTKEAIHSFVVGLVERKVLKEESVALLDDGKLYRFFNSNLAKRMALAQQSGNLYREQPFVIGIQAKEVKESFESDDLVLIQGIIDVYFEEEDGIVLVDYKTDAVSEQAENELIRRYKEQLRYYERALNQLTDKKVKEKYIYSFALGKVITVP